MNSSAPTPSPEDTTYLEYRGFFQKMRLRYFRKVLKRYRLTAGMRMLDYGCGPGDMLQIASACGLEAHGIDASARSVELAKERGLDIALGDHRDMSWPEEHFDVIFLQSVIEHVEDPVELVAGLKPYLKPGGTLVLSSPTPGSHFWDDPTHIRPYTPASFLTLADICELEVREVSYVFAFLLGLRLKNSFFYKLLNVLPFATGSNIIGAFVKPEPKG